MTSKTGSFFLCLLTAGLVIRGEAADQKDVIPPSTPFLRERLLMDGDWLFALGNAQDPKADFDFGQNGFSFLAKQHRLGVSSLEFNDSAWKKIDLPHDWAMSLPFDPKAEQLWGSRPLGRNYPATSVGWYRKKFSIPESDKGKRIMVEFDGVFQSCTLFCNGILMGTHQGGYSSFQFDVTDALHYGDKNQLVVRVDASLREGWWYEGAGIYRHVWLTKTSPVHIPKWGTQILTDMAKDQAKVTAKTEVLNESPKAATVELRTSVLDAGGIVVSSFTTPQGSVEPGEKHSFESTMNVPQPKLWSLEEPNLYQLVVTVVADGKVVDTASTPFGIRTVVFDPDKGFLLNGKPVKIKGVCDHQQHAGVGVAMPDALWDWRIRKMKEMGANAIRMSHNPPAPEFLDACDRLGMLVMDEQRLFSSGQEGLRQLESMVRRDRNHPSIIIWSAGNEEWGIQNSEASGPIQTALQNAFHRLDPTRLVTYAGSNGGYLLGANKAADVRGINYISQFTSKGTNASTVGTVDEYHAKYPLQPIIGTEDSCPDEKSWQFAAARDYYSGLFIWTGFAYYGESKWPNVSGWGALDLCGFPRDGYRLYRKLWAGKDDPSEPKGIIPTEIAAEPDRLSIKADGEDLSVVTIKVVDASGKRVDKAEVPLEVTLSGPGKILALANGNDQSHELGDPVHVRSYKGEAQALVQSTRETGTIRMEVKSTGLKSATLTINTTP